MGHRGFGKLGEWVKVKSVSHLMFTYPRTINNFLSEELVLSVGSAAEESPVHLDVPGVRVQRGHQLAREPRVQERVVVRVRVFTCKLDSMVNYLFGLKNL